MYGYYERENKVDVKTYLSGENPAATFQVGPYVLTIAGFTPDNPPEITYRREDRYRSADPRQTFPNMEVRDGTLTLPVEDIVGLMMERLDPKELAASLWEHNEEVRTAFMEAMTEHYMSGIPDDTRRKFLAAIKEDVHSRKLDILAEKMSKLEYSLSQRSFFYHEINRINDALKQTEENLSDSMGEGFKLPRINHTDNDPDFKIGGKHWNEARDFWRTEVAQYFPGPEAE